VPDSYGVRPKIIGINFDPGHQTLVKSSPELSSFLNVSILQFRRYYLIYMHVTACNLETSFSFNKKVEMTSHVRYPTHV